MSRKVDPFIGLFALLIGLATLVYARSAFMPGSPWVIADDARQFLAWTSRITDPAAMPNNSMVDYWQQTAPPFYRALLYASASIGLQPLILSKLLPLALLPLSGLMAWRLSGAFAQSRAAQFGGALCVIGTALHTDSIFSGTPRAFALPLILFTLYGMAVGRNRLALIGLLLLGVVYPAPAVTCLGLFALHVLKWQPLFRLHLTRDRIGLLAVAAAVVVVPALIFKSGLDEWGPTLRLSEARNLFSMMLYDGRSTITGPDGSIAWLCSRRIGFLPAVVNCRGNTDPRLLINLCVTILPILGLWWWKARPVMGTSQQEGELSRWRLFPYSLASALLCYLIAASIAFTVHLPARYSQPILIVMGSLAFGLLAGAAWTRLARVGTSRRLVVAMPTLALAVWAYATPKTTLVRPRDPDLMPLIAQTPPDVRIAGIADDLDFVPAATGRGVLATTEHDIPYHRRYHALNGAGLRASMVMSELDSPAAVAAIRRHRIDLLVFDGPFLANGELPGRYPLTMAPPHRIRPSASHVAALRAAGCRVVETDRTVLIFTDCLR